MRLTIVEHTEGEPISAVLAGTGGRGPTREAETSAWAERVLLLERQEKVVGDELVRHPNTR